MIRLFVLLLGLMAFVGDARADYNATPKSFNCNQSGKVFDDQNTACQYLSSSISTPIPYAGGAQSATPTGSYPGPYGCLARYSTGATSQMSCTNAWSCPYGGTLNGTRCIGANPPPTCVPQAIGTMDITSAWATGSQPGSAIAVKIVPDGAFGPVASGLPAAVTYCSDGCIVQPTGMPSAPRIEQTPSSNGYYRIHLPDTPMSRTGGSCTVSSSGSPSGPGPYPDPSAIPPQPSTPNTKGSTGGCPDGTVAAGQDPYGMTKCIGQSKPPSAAPPTNTTTGPATTTTNPDGSTTTTQSTTTTNADGSTSTVVKVVTTAADGTTTTKTNTTTGNTPGGTAGTQDRPQDQTDLCKLHPELTVCRNSQVTGTCAQIACDGDAIQCATLRAAAQIQCQQQQDIADLKASSQYGLGAAVASGADPAGSTLPTPSKADVVTVSNPDTSGWLGAGSYFKDKTITLPSGQTLVLPLSQGANLMIALRYVTMIVCSLVCFNIIRGTFAATGV